MRELVVIDLILQLPTPVAHRRPFTTDTLLYNSKRFIAREDASKALTVKIKG
jgi:hypothetical protein